MLGSEERRTLITYGLVVVHAGLGEKEKAVGYLTQLLEAGLLRGWVLGAFTGGNPDLNQFATDPDVQRLLAKAAPWKRLWEGQAFGMPYQPNLSDDEKVAGLSRFWAEVKYNFAYFASSRRWTGTPSTWPTFLRSKRRRPHWSTTVCCSNCARC